MTGESLDRVGPRRYLCSECGGESATRLPNHEPDCPLLDDVDTTDDDAHVVTVVDQTDAGKLIVDGDGQVSMHKPIAYDGVLTFTTEDRPTLRSRRKRSEGGLSANEVVRRYLEHLNPDATYRELVAATNEAVREAGR